MAPCRRPNVGVSVAPRVRATQQRCFTVPGSDGKEVDLVPGASEAKVTFDNKDTWAQLAMDYRLHEFDRQVCAPPRSSRAVSGCCAAHLGTVLLGVSTGA